VAVRAARNLWRTKRLREDDLGVPETFPDVRHEAISKVVEAAAAPSADGEDGRWLSALEGFTLLKEAGIPIAPIASVSTPEEAVAAARAAAGPVALKLDGEAFLHKTDLGAVLLGVEGDEAVARGAERLVELARAHALGTPWRLLVQAMAAKGVEMVLGAKEDPVFGPVLMVGLGGIHVEVWRDVAFGVVPLTRRLAERMLRRLRGYPLLTGARGAPPVDVHAVATALLRLGEVVARHPGIREIEVNPLVARPDGVTAVDARVRVGPPSRRAT
jgi:acyl-CoA synthetase (NDP forming)